MVKGLQANDKDARLQNRSLALGAVLIYSFNALIYRPAEGRGETMLLEAACQHIYDSIVNAKRPIMYDHGLYFVSDIVNHNHGYSLPNKRCVDAEHLLFFYRRDSMEDIADEFTPQPSGPAVYKPKARAPKRKRSAFSFLANCDHVVADVLQKILKLLPSDVFQHVPRRKPRNDGPADDSWVYLTQEEQHGLTIEIFASLDLSRIFRHAQYCIVDEQEWHDLVFSRYFPAKDAPSSKSLQHFPSAKYFQGWLDLMGGLTKSKAEDLRKELFHHFSALHWLPYPLCDRMWTTKPAKSKKWLPLLGERVGPQLAINSAHWKKDEIEACKQRRMMLEVEKEQREGDESEEDEKDEEDESVVDSESDS